MNSDNRMRLQIARTGQYGDVMRTTFLAFAAIAAVVGFGAEGVDLPLAILTVAVTLFGALGGGTALEDISALRDDMDEGTAASAYGQQAKGRNLDLLRLLSAGLLGLTGLLLVLAIFLV